MQPVQDSFKLQIMCSLQVPPWNVSTHEPPLRQLSLQLVTCRLHAVCMQVACCMQFACGLRAGYMQFTCLLHAGSCWSGQCKQRCDKCWSTAAVCAREDGGGHLQGSERHCHGYQQPQNIWSVPAVSDQLAHFWAQARCRQQSLSRMILQLSRQ